MNDGNLSEPNASREPNSTSIVTLSRKEYDELKDKIYSLKNDLSRLKQKNIELAEENRKVVYKLGLLLGQPIAQGVVLKDLDQL